eukprot:s3105_g1.t1
MEEPPKLRRVSTTKMMKDYSQRAPIVLLAVILVNGCCCFWVPMIFFFAADNVLEKCERYEAGLHDSRDDLDRRGEGFQDVVEISSSKVFKLGLRLQFLTSFVTIGLVIWGWIEYSNTTEENCVGDGGINPRTLAVVLLILASFSAPGLAVTAIKKGCAKDLGPPRRVPLQLELNRVGSSRSFVVDPNGPPEASSRTLLPKGEALVAVG